MISLNIVGSNARADEMKLGFSSTEQLKGEYVRKVSRWDIKCDARTKEMV